MPELTKWSKSSGIFSRSRNTCRIRTSTWKFRSSSTRVPLTATSGDYSAYKLRLTWLRETNKLSRHKINKEDWHY